MDDTRKLLTACELFAGLEGGTIELLAAAASRQEVPAGADLYTQGSRRRACYVIVEGKV